MVRRRGLRLPVRPRVGSQGPGTELDADDSGIWLILQSHHVAVARADRPGAVPVAGRRWPRGPAEQLRHVDEGDFPPGRMPPGAELVSVKTIFPPAKSCQVP